MDSKLMGTTSTFQKDENEIMSLACDLYERGAWAESFRLLLRLSSAGAKSASLFYNEALCVWHAGNVDKAIEYLEKALVCLKSGKREQEKPTGEEQTILTLYQQQCAQAQYTFAMRQEEVEYLPTYARERILRLLIDLCAQQNDGARVRTLAASLPSKNFENINKALLQTSTKEN